MYSRMQAVLGLAATAGTHLAPTTNFHINASPAPASSPFLNTMNPTTTSTTATIPDYTTSEAGNPFVSGWYADPDVGFYEGQYWIYPTSSLPYAEQTYLDAFSSPDLVHWTKHPRILTTESISWAREAVWAPSPVSRNGKYYLYFAANDIQVDEIAAGKIGGIGVAVADHPAGPFRDAIGKPLIGDFHNGAQPIDQDVFIDRKGSDGRGDEPGTSAVAEGQEGEDDGAQAYMYYGGHGHANVVKLNSDMISLGSFSSSNTTSNDTGIFREITPKDYTEGSQMFTRKGVYYYMWSSGDWTGPSYSVSYAMSRDSPLGPFSLPPSHGGNGTASSGRILDQDPAIAKGSGHNGVMHVPGTDIWYIVYHRRPLSETDGNHRVVCYDRMYFDDDNGGAILPVQMLVKDNFADGDMIGWNIFHADEQGGEARPDISGNNDGEGREKGKWEVKSQSLVGSNHATPATPNSATFAMLDTNFTDFTMDATISFPRLYDPSTDDDWMPCLVLHADGNTREGYGAYTLIGFRPEVPYQQDTTAADTDIKVQIRTVSVHDGIVQTVHSESIVLANPSASTPAPTAGASSTTNPDLDFVVRLVAVGNKMIFYTDPIGANDETSTQTTTGPQSEAGADTMVQRREPLVLQTSRTKGRSGANGFAIKGTIEGIRFGNVSVKHAPPGMVAGH